jgi:hypothetical protein
MKVIVHIDRLVLDGLAAEAAHPARVEAALVRELTRLLAQPHGSQTTVFAGGAIPLLRAPDIRMTRGEAPEATGVHIAASLYRGLGRRR